MTIQDNPVVATAAAPPAHRPGWLHGPLVDTLLAWCYLPIAVAVHFAEPHLTTVRAMVAVIFLISFAHQPLTLGLVYGDPLQVAAHRSIYRWTPFVVVALVVLGLGVSLTTVAVMADPSHVFTLRPDLRRVHPSKRPDYVIYNNLLNGPFSLAGYRQAYVVDAGGAPLCWVYARAR